MIEVPNGNILNPRGTPLHVSDLLHLIVKETFIAQTNPDWPFKFSENFEESEIAIVTTFNKADATYGKKPIIVIARGGQSASPAVLNDRAAENTFTNNKLGTSVLRSSVEIKVISKLPREVDILSQHVFNIVMMCRVFLPRAFKILTIDGISMSPVMQIEQDDQMYFTSISMGYQMQYIWKHFIPQVVLDSITMRLNDIDVFLLEK